MVDTTDSPSSLLGDGEYTTDEDVWSPSLRRDIFSHDNTTTRRSPSPRQNISPPYLNHLDTGASTEQQPRTQQQPLYHLSPPPSLTQVLNTFSSSQLSSQPSGASQDLPQSTLDAQSENHSSAASVESEPSSRSISPISWNVLSSDSEPGTHRINDPDLRQESVVASSNPHPNTSQQTSSDFVDLTGEADTLLRARMSCASPQRGPNKRRRVGSNASASSPRGNQRRKTQSQNAVPPAVEEVDLRDVDDDKGLSKVLEDQRMATIKAQQEQASRPVKLATLSCVICMDQMTDVTATYCGMPPDTRTPFMFQSLSNHS